MRNIPTISLLLPRLRFLMQLPLSKPGYLLVPTQCTPLHDGLTHERIISMEKNEGRKYGEDETAAACDIRWSSETEGIRRLLPRP